MGRKQADSLADALLGISVLAVDDEADSCELLKTILVYAGALVTVVSSAAAAIRSLREMIPDVIVSDIAMPGRDGYSLIRWIRGRPAAEGGLVPAIAITGFDHEHGSHRTLAAGFQAHLRKPIDPRELCDAVGKLGRGPAPGR